VAESPTRPPDPTEGLPNFRRPSVRRSGTVGDRATTDLRSGEWHGRRPCHNTVDRATHPADNTHPVVAGSPTRPPDPTEGLPNFRRPSVRRSGTVGDRATTRGTVGDRATHPADNTHPVVAGSPTRPPDPTEGLPNFRRPSVRRSGTVGDRATTRLLRSIGDLRSGEVARSETVPQHGYCNDGRSCCGPVSDRPLDDRTSPEPSCCGRVSDPATGPDRRSPEVSETFGPAKWHGRRPCHNTVIATTEGLVVAGSPTVPQRVILVSLGTQA
jgi:hypothetical protein